MIVSEIVRGWVEVHGSCWCRGLPQKDAVIDCAVEEVEARDGGDRRATEAIYDTRMQFGDTGQMPRYYRIR